MGKRGKSALKPGLVRKLTPEEREDERQRLGKPAEDARARMEVESLRVRDLILTQAPVALLGYLWGHLHTSVLSEVRQKGEDEYRPNKDLIQKFQLALEYVHAVWCTTSNLPDAKTPLNEPKVAQLFDALDDLRGATFHYCMASSAANIEGEESRQSAKTEFHAKTTWALIRGNRYQVLEEEFFKFILGPHDEALLKAYGMDSAAIAKGIQSIADSMRTGFSDAAQKMFDGMEKNICLHERERRRSGHRRRQNERKRSQF